MSSNETNLPPIPDDLLALYGKPMFEHVSEGPIDLATIRQFASVVQDSHPSYWYSARTEADAQLSVPPALLSTWNRVDMWRPDRTGDHKSLELHFLIKDRLELPLAVVVESSISLDEPMQIGSYVRMSQVLESISKDKVNRLGVGRYWTLNIEYHCNATNAHLGTESLCFFGYRKAAIHD